MGGGIRTVINVQNTTLATPKFNESMRKCFIAVGLGMDEETGKFVKYKDHKRGHMSTIHSDVEKQLGMPDYNTWTLGDQVTELEILRAPTDVGAREADEEGTLGEEEGEGSDEEAESESEDDGCE